MADLLRTSQAIIEPRFFANVHRMTAKELRERISYLSRYLQNISPRVSVYESLKAERAACRTRLDQLNALPQ